MNDISANERAEVENLSPDDKIRVSNNRSLFFYVDLATKFLVDHETVEISGLGGAIPSVVKIAEILKNQDIAKIVSISTSTTEIQGKHSPKPKIDIVVSKSDVFDKVKQEKDLLAQENKEIYLAVEKAQKELQERLSSNDPQK
jgi:DNA-binding protein